MTSEDVQEWINDNVHWAWEQRHSGALSLFGRWCREHGLPQEWALCHVALLSDGVCSHTELMARIYNEYVAQTSEVN